MSKASKYPREPPETPSPPPNSTREPEPTSARRTGPTVSSPRSNANASPSAARKSTVDPTSARRTGPAASSPRSNANPSPSATKKSTVDPPALHPRRDTLEIPSPSPDRHALPLTNGHPEASSPPRHVKRIKVRLGTPEDVFASEPSSPERDGVVGVQGSPSQTRSGPSAPWGVEGAPVGASVYPRAPPRVVDSLHGQVLVDREGHVPRAFPREEKDAAEEEDGEDKVQWPPARGHTAKERRASGPDVEVDAHHAFSQLQPRPWPEAPRETGELGERQQPVDGSPVDRRTVAALFSGQVPQVEGEQRENGASPVKRVVTTTPPSDPFSRHIQKSRSKEFKFPAPRASTRSPFRPEETRPRPPQARSPSPTRTKAARHPALNRIRRQTIGHGNGNVNGHEHGHGQVPSVDLVALSHSSVSARSNSHSSAGALVPARPSRWSLPAFAATPWVFNEPDGAPIASGSAVRWTAPSPAYGEMWQGPARTSSPRFLWTPSPARSITGVVNDPRSSSESKSPPVSLTPHPPDVHLTASHGLASILAHMSANHGLALGVVEAVYKRVGSLKEADEVLKGMREAAEGFGEGEIERRGRMGRESGVRNGVGRGRKGEEARGGGSGKTRLRYVVASEDGEGSEYSPPETSRAALWKRQSESASYSEEGKERDEEEAAVEEELWESDEHEDSSRHADLAEDVTSQEEDSAQEPQEDAWEQQSVTDALLEDTRFAHELERRIGKGRYRRDIARLFA
ncbi:hypothetical protein OG21DRAFT_1516638 [Imleria badia]|nr:hypothetical protein OG21DRAFT_1516638 [Imleria badia]